VQFAYSLLQIIIIDLALSGDNAVVIGMAAHRLPPHQRKIAIVFGGGGAIVLRVLLTIIAALLLRISGLQVAGGLLLIWIAFKLLKEEEESAEGVDSPRTLRKAILTILLADLVMSTDNVIAVAGASAGNTTLLMFGLVLSMVILMWMGSVVANLINKFGWLSYVGAAVIAWTGALMIFEDRLVLARAAWISRPVAYIAAGVITIAVTGFAHWFHRVRET
jgi:YjbE family integral membrane protein